MYFRARRKSIEARLNEVRGWWQRHKAGESVPDAPDPVFLWRTLLNGLDIAGYVNQQIENLGACLSLLKEKEQTQREMGESKHQVYRTRFNQYGPLKNLGRLDEAQQVAEECLASEREAGDQYGQSKALSALADIWNERCDIEQAIALERQSLSIKNQLPDPSDRPISHGNLSTYLETAGKLDDSAKHLLAAIIYRLIARHYAPISDAPPNPAPAMNCRECMSFWHALNLRLWGGLLSNSGLMLRSCRGRWMRWWKRREIESGF